MNSLNMSEIPEIPENVHVTSVERHYKVKSSKIEFIIAVKSELDESVTKKLLREEDVELKILLAGSTKYEIKNIMIPSFKKKKEEEKKEEKEDIKEEKKEEKEGINGYNKTSKWLNPEQRVELVKELPEKFGMKDFVDKLIEKGYSEFEAKNIWKATRDALTKSKKLEIIKGRQKRDMRYRYIGGD